MNLVTLPKIRHFQKLTERLQSKLSDHREQQLINLTKDELASIIEALGDYIITLENTYGDEQYHEMVDRMEM